MIGKHRGSSIGAPRAAVRRVRKEVRIGSVLFKAAILLFLAVEVYPILWMLLSSFKATHEFTVNPSYALPAGLYLKNYADAWTTGHMGVFFKNSLITTSVSLVLIVLLSTSVSFALVKMRWRLRKAAMSFFLSGIMVPSRSFSFRCSRYTSPSTCSIPTGA